MHCTNVEDSVILQRIIACNGGRHFTTNDALFDFVNSLSDIVNVDEVTQRQNWVQLLRRKAFQIVYVAVRRVRVILNFVKLNLNCVA